MSVTSGAVLDLDGQDAAPPGQDRRRAVFLGSLFALVLAGAFVGRDGPLATAPFEPAATLRLPPGTADATLFTFPDRLANEPLTNMTFVAVPIRSTEGLAAKVGSPGGVWLVTWTEGGTAYWLSSEHRELLDLVNLAGRLR